MADLIRAFAEILNGVSMGIVVVDSIGIVLQANSQAEAILGYAHGTLVGQPIEMLVPAGWDPARMGAVSPAVGRQADGTHFLLDISLAPALVGNERLVVVSLRERDSV